jgi:hypothetical protein
VVTGLQPDRTYVVREDQEQAREVAPTPFAWPAPGEHGQHLHGSGTAADAK